MDRVLLTGANGFTGKYVERELASRGYQVVGVVLRDAKPGQVVCDLTDYNSVVDCLYEIKPSYIINLAAISFVGHENHKAFYDVNVFCALNLLEAAKALKLELKKIIFASSANIYGCPSKGEFISEDSPPAPVSHYAMSKLAMEYMVKLWFKEYPILITRPFNYTGPGQEEHFLIPKIVSHFKRSERIIELGNIEISRDFSDVRDIANSYVNLLESNVDSEVVNLCSGRVISLHEIIELVQEIAGYKISISINDNFIRKDEIKILGGDNHKLSLITHCVPSITINKTLVDMYYE